MATREKHFTEQLVQMYLDGKITTSGDLAQFISHYAVCEPEVQYGNKKQSEKTETEVAV